MRILGIEARYPKRHLSRPTPSLQISGRCYRLVQPLRAQLAALGAFRLGPEIRNSDQDSQFTSADFLAPPRDLATSFVYFMIRQEG